MKTKNLNMRSSRMRSIQSPINGWTLDTNVNTLEYKTYVTFLLAQKTCILPRPVTSIPWVNVIFTKDSNTQFTLTYVSWLIYIYIFYISNPLPSTATINDINPVYTLSNCNYNYKNNNDPVIVRTIESGKSIGGFNDNELQLPCRFIVFTEIPDSTKIGGYFYINVDSDQKVSLSK